MPVFEEMSRAQLITLVRRQGGQVTVLSTQVADLMEVGEQVAALTARNEELAARNEELAIRLARLEHLLSRKLR